MRLTENARLRALSALTAVAALLTLACGERSPKVPSAKVPSASSSTVAPAPRPPASASAAAPASASAPASAPASASAPAPASAPASASASAPPARPPARAAHVPDPPPRGKPGGRIPPEIIQRIIRANFGRFRLCYENGLRNCPNLHGRVAVRFVIDIDGTVKKPRIDSSDYADLAVSTCVANAFRDIRFPQPEGGTITVVYPILFSPGE